MVINMNGQIKHTLLHATGEIRTDKHTLQRMEYAAHRRAVHYQVDRLLARLPMSELIRINAALGLVK